MIMEQVEQLFSITKGVKKVKYYIKSRSICLVPPVPPSQAVADYSKNEDDSAKKGQPPDGSPLYVRSGGDG